MIVVAALLLAVVLGVAAHYFGADSRPGFDERPDHARFGALR